MLNDFWQRRFGESPPAVADLRRFSNQCWIRFHSMPGSKRYPESTVEWGSVLERYNPIVSELASDGTELVLLTTTYSASPFPDSPAQKMCIKNTSAKHWRSFAVYEIAGDDAPNYGHVFQTVIAWKRNALDEVFRLVAVDRMSNTMLLDSAGFWVFHPYDGGMDVTCETVNERDRLMCKYNSWCSHRVDSL